MILNAILQKWYRYSQITPKRNALISEYFKQFGQIAIILGRIIYKTIHSNS